MAVEDLRQTNELEGHPFLAAEGIYLWRGIESAVVGLDDISIGYLRRAHSLILPLLKNGFAPFLGYRPELQLSNWDDAELDYHWALVRKAKYIIDVLIGEKPDREDVAAGLRCLQNLISTTCGLRGKIDVNKDRIVIDYFWFTALLRDRDSDRWIRRQIKNLGDPRRVTIRAFGTRQAFVRWLSVLSGSVCGHDELGPAAEAGSRNLVRLYSGMERLSEKTCCSGALHAFCWTWLTSNIYSERPQLSDVLAVLRGWHDWVAPDPPVD